MLLNLTNHPHRQWPDKQMEDARSHWGQVQDFPFPNVPPDWDDKQLLQASRKTAEEAIGLHPDAVLCQGEMSMTYAIVRALQESGIPAYTATTHRKAEETKNPDGTVSKKSEFCFIRFRRYPEV